MVCSNLVINEYVQHVVLFLIIDAISCIDTLIIFHLIVVIIISHYQDSVQDFS